MTTDITAPSMTHRMATEHVVVRKLKIFAALATIMTVFQYLLKLASDEYVADPIRVGVIFGTVLTLMSGFAFGRADAGLPRGRAARARQSVTTELDVPLAVAVERARAAMRGLPTREVAVAGGAHPEVRATTRRGGLRGEQVQVRFTALGASRTRATVDSRPRLPIAVADDGEGWRNVERLLVALEHPDAALTTQPEPMSTR